MALLAAFCFLGGAKAQKALPYSYGFENNDLAGEGWTTVNESTANESEFGITYAAKHDGDYGFRFSSYSSDSSYDQYLISPELSTTSGIALQFYYKASDSKGTEKFKVGYSATDANITSFTFGDEISTKSTTWTQSEKFIIPAGTKYVAIYYYSSYQYRLFVDDFGFTETDAIPKPIPLAPDDVTSNSVKLSWKEMGAATKWVVAYKAEGETDFTEIEVTTNPYTLESLQAGTAYTIKVRAKNDNILSDWSREIIFRTDCTDLDKCYITYKLNAKAYNGSYAYGWYDSYLFVLDEETEEIIDYWTVPEDTEDGIVTGSLQVCSGRPLRFVWYSGGFDNYFIGDIIVQDVNGEDIINTTGALNADVLYTVDCIVATCAKPKNLAVTEIGTTTTKLSWEGTNDSYLLQYRPWHQVGEDQQATATLTTYTYDLSEYSGMGSIAIRHYDVSDMFMLNVDDIVVKNAVGTTVYTQDFENGTIPSEITNMDLDGDGYQWGIRTNGKDDQNNLTGNGTYSVSSASWVTGVGALSPDNWMIISGIQLGGSISFVAKGQDPNYPAENFAVYVSAETDLVEVPLTATSYTATGLTPNTPYAWQVKGICGPGEESKIASSFFKTKDDMLVFSNDGDWNRVANWTDVDGNAVTALPTINNNVRIKADATIPAGVVACAGKATIDGGSITIEDGGQLKHKTATLRVTMNKNISGYGDGEGKYNLIASPFTGVTFVGSDGSTWSYVGDLAKGDYDLFGFDATEDLEWINYEANRQQSAFVAGDNIGLKYLNGYLCANKEDKTLDFTGTAPSSYNSTNTADVTYDATSTNPFNGWALVGNPFTCNGYISYSKDASFYKMNAAGDGFEVYKNAVVLAPGEGAFIKVAASGTITYSSEVPAGTFSGSAATGTLPFLPLHGLDINQDANLEGLFLNFAKEGFATYYNSQRDVVLPEDMVARIVTAKDESVLTYETIAEGGEVVPAATAVLLQIASAEAASQQPIFLAGKTADPITLDNMLHGSDVAATTTGGGKYYMLSYDKSGENIGWYWGVDNGAAFTSGAHKAYLAVPAGTRSFLALPGYDETTGIADVNRETTTNNDWFTVDGKKLNKQPTRKGLYIQNGNKVVIK